MTISEIQILGLFLTNFFYLFMFYLIGSCFKKLFDKLFQQMK